MTRTLEGRYRLIIFSEDEAVQALGEMMRDQGWPGTKQGRSLIEQAIRMAYGNGYKVVVDKTEVRLPKELLSEVVAGQSSSPQPPFRATG
jgi:hypothetical protein